MTKYHFNRDTGQVGICHAQIQCRLGLSEAEHFPTKNAAQKAYEQTMEKKNSSSISLRNIKKSKRMSYALRHHPEKFPFNMSEDGSVPLEAFSKALGVDVDTVREIAAADDKQRFVIQGDRIWAAQGHTFKVNVPLVKVYKVEKVYHGTKRQFLSSIQESGLTPQKRQYVHLSRNMETAIKVASRRSGDNIILVIDAQKLIDDGYEMLKSSNNVYLTKTVPWKYVLEIIEL